MQNNCIFFWKKYKIINEFTSSHFHSLPDVTFIFRGLVLCFQLSPYTNYNSLNDSSNILLFWPHINLKTKFHQ